MKPPCPSTIVEGLGGFLRLETNLMSSHKTRLPAPTSPERSTEDLPLVMSPEMESALRRLRPEAATPGGVHDLYSRSRAMLVLKDSSEYRWLLDWDAAMRGEDRAWRPLILTELGRLADAETIKRVAGVLCQRKPQTRSAVAFLRRLRQVSERPGDAAALAGVIGAAVNRYRRAHPGTTLDHAAEALAMQSRIVADFQKRVGRAAGATEADQGEPDDPRDEQ